MKEILNSLVVRNKQAEDSAFNEQIDKLRMRIDEYDTKLIQVLGKRMRIADEIGRLKKENNVAVLQNLRWKRSEPEKLN